MWYAKNLPAWERIVRFGGALLMAVGAWHVGMTPIGWVLAASAAITVFTALVGFCPMCALVGRRAVEK
jgi:hypothetical protein